MTKPKKDKFYLVQEDILPEAIKKTIKVKEILKLGEVKTINEAVEKMDLSRSAYYKYKDYVFPFFEIAQGKIVSITVSMSNESGMLSSVLKAIADKNGSILTINQDIPLQGIANSSISFETKNLQGSLEELLHDIRNMKGIIKVEILGQAYYKYYIDQSEESRTIMKTVKIALLGFGTVSQGTFNLLQDNVDLITNRSGVTIEISKIFVRNPDKYTNITLPSTAQYVTNIDDVLNDESIAIVVELMGGTTFAKDCVEAALKHGKSVVTANKDLLAEAGPYLFDLAYKNHVDLRFEASVLGGIPIIRTLYDSLGGNRITELVGIMNGTTNFILSKMTDEGLSYGDVLKEAQDLGYAEADPTADVEGLDAARKLAILASISFNRRIFFEDVTVEGITKIDTEDISFGKEFGYNIKLIGIAKESSKGLSLNVYPAFVPLTHPLASVRGSYNAIYIKGNGIDDAMFYGRGAGSLPTGSSVVSDIMEVAKNVAFESTGRFKPFYFDQKNIYSPGKIQSSYYMRLAVDNKTGVLAKIATKLAEQKISVLSIVQRNKDPETAVLAIVTSKCPHSYILNLIDSFNSLRSVKEVSSVIRIMEA